jgi:hypothetical protein
MATRYRTENIPVENVRAGDELAIPSDGGHRTFHVEDIAVGHFKEAGQQPTLTLTSEPLANGKPWVLQYPVGASVARVLGTYEES